ncbi:MAG: sn-glycerol-1-phosphate dehydrogenase, partial [Firmicutes bacterium]|nr:sn-glycerol-1-phosphate dehydrogenase [Bacillota bacterium]
PASFACECGRVHACPIKETVIGPGAVFKVPGLLEGISSVLIVSDANTRPLVWEALAGSLSEAGIRFREAFFDTSEILVPNEEAIGFIDSKLEEAPSCDIEAVIGIGSGVINDLCKYTSFKKNLPYMIIATAPSMDGFASVGAALILKGMKVTLSTHTPSWIVGDTGILKNAPLEMIRAGIGDILGKYSCLNDWKLSHLITGEYLCPAIYDMTLQEVKNTCEAITGCMKRDEAAIGALMEALVGVGILMAYMGNSRPASGSEHHLSHFFEITGVAFKEPYLPHGIDVGYASLITASLRQMLALSDPSGFHYAFDPASWEQSIRSVYKGLADEVIRLQQKTGFYQKDHLPFIKAHWNEIRRILLDAPSRQEMEQMLAAAGFTYSEFETFYTKDRIRASIRWAKDLKDRYTLLWLLCNTSQLEPFAKQI